MVARKSTAAPRRPRSTKRPEPKKFEGFSRAELDAIGADNPPAVPVAPPLAKPNLAAVAVDTSEQKFSFAGGQSHLGGLLGIGGSLPMRRYDPETLSHILNVDADGKADTMDALCNVADGVGRTIRLIGLLVSAQDKEAGYLDHDAIEDLGWTLRGLGDMSLQLLRVIAEVQDCTPAEAANG